MGLASVIDLKAATKELAKGVAVATVAASVRTFVVAALALALNVALSVLFFWYAPLTGQGHGSILGLVFAVVPFVPFVVLAVVVAMKQAGMRVLAGAVESQRESVAALTEHYLGGYLRERLGDPMQTRFGKDFERSWKAYLDAHDTTPRPIRFLLGALAARVPLGELVHDAASEGTPAEALPRVVVASLVERLSRDKLRPGVGPVALVFVVNVAWLPLVTWLFRMKTGH